MDKSVKAEQETHKEAPQKSTSTSSPTAPTQTLDNITTNDDDSITTSTESSDTFDTWTLVMDKKKLDATEHVEILRNSDGEDDVDETVEDEDEKDHKKLQDSVHDATADDFSDGISIISESESNGRVSPHPYLRDHLQDLNLRFATSQTDEDEIMHKINDDTKFEPCFPAPVIMPPEQQVRQRNVRTQLDETAKQEERYKALEKTSQTLAEQLPPIVKRGLQGIFYIGVALAILALIGRMRNPTWGSSTPSSAELEQKVNEMELQNNLMRAEIDLLNKQVKYLSNTNEPQQYAKKSGKFKGHNEDNREDMKKFKAWSGIGDSLRPIDITKEDLKRPYKCPDGSFKEFAGMCVEKRSNEPNIVEQFEQVVEDTKQQSETMQTFEKVAQELHGFTESPLEQVQDFLAQKPNYKTEDFKQQQQQQFEYQQKSHKPGEEYQRQPRRATPYDKEETAKSEDGSGNKPKLDRNSHDDSGKPYQKDYKKPYDKQSRETKDKPKYPSKERKHKHAPHDVYDDYNDSFNKRGNESKERYQKREDNSKERFRRNGNSKERYSKHEDDSKERFRKREDDDSHERFGNKRSKERSSKENFNKQKLPNESGEWQEQYMKHREELRKQNEQKYSGENKNWYMKRADGRENKRNGDIPYR